jgi:hypothetical protein
MKSGVYKRKVDKPDELLDSILDAAACIKKREDQLRRTTRDLRTRVAKLSGADFQTFILNCNKFVISAQRINHLNIKFKFKLN